MCGTADSCGLRATVEAAPNPNRKQLRRTQSSERGVAVCFSDLADLVPRVQGYTQP